MRISLGLGFAGFLLIVLLLSFYRTLVVLVLVGYLATRQYLPK